MLDFQSCDRSAHNFSRIKLNCLLTLVFVNSDMYIHAYIRISNSCIIILFLIWSRILMLCNPSGLFVPFDYFRVYVMMKSDHGKLNSTISFKTAKALHVCKSFHLTMFSYCPSHSFIKSLFLTHAAPLLLDQKPDSNVSFTCIRKVESILHTPFSLHGTCLVM